MTDLENHMPIIIHPGGCWCDLCQEGLAVPLDKATREQVLRVLNGIGHNDSGWTMEVKDVVYSSFPSGSGADDKSPFFSSTRVSIGNREWLFENTL